MKVIFGLRRLKKYKRPVVALGVFDGVHRGHSNILKAVVRKARSIKGTSVVLTFWPHPQKEESIYSIGHRLRLIKELGIDVCAVISFNQKFAKIQAVDFIKDILAKKIGAYYIYVGKNFRFGKGAKGGLKVLDRLSRLYNFKLKVFKVIKEGNAPISSTYIRTLIKQGDLDTARKLLLRPVNIFGTVIRGASIAEKMGFSTANINPHHEVIPPSGVYAVKIILGDKKLNGICNIGTKPTFDNRQYAIGNRQKRKYIEAHIFNFNKNIYGRNLEVQFIKKIRDERKFNSRDLLAGQIKKDIACVKHIFSLH